MSLAICKYTKYYPKWMYNKKFTRKMILKSYLSDFCNYIDSSIAESTTVTEGESHVRIQTEMFMFTKEQLDEFIHKIKRQVYNEIACSKIKGCA